MKMDKERKELYDALAQEMPVVREILDGTTTFAESLDQIAAAIEEHDDNAAGAFIGWYTAAALLTDLPLAEQETMNLVGYAIRYSKSLSKMHHILDGTSIGAGALMVAVSLYIERDPRLRNIARLFAIGGGSAVAGFSYDAVKYHLEGKSGKAAVDGYLDKLMVTAKELDKDVAAYHVEVEDETFDEALVVDAEKQAAEQDAAFDDALLPEEPVAPEPERDPALDEWTGKLDGEGRWD